MTFVSTLEISEIEFTASCTALAMVCDSAKPATAAWIERQPDAAPAAYRGLSGPALQSAISRDVKGVLQVQFMPPDSDTFGHELIVGLRRTREFGMVLSAGLGGTDTELYAQRFRKGQAIVAASTELTDAESFFGLFRQTISYKKLAGLTRGQRRIVSDEQLIECFESFIAMANHYAPTNPDAPFIIEELEINPFAFTDYLMVPLDGMCRFSVPKAQAVGRPIAKIHNLLHPGRIGIVGVSATRCAGRGCGRLVESGTSTGCGVSEGGASVGGVTGSGAAGAAMSCSAGRAVASRRAGSMGSPGSACSVWPPTKR